MKRQLLIVLMLSVTSSLFAQLTVEGTVTDASTGETLIGVTIQIKGTPVGTITDINGKYRLESAQLSEFSVLVYSYIGYAKIEQDVGNLTVIDVKLIPEQ
ncbi:MAG: carboxypeptidase-like regulatory domain-containing protein, partial [Bacteroidales bacterium]|nr:carboxypeptidase-like regulatory domain-containing protein [Bacteroidales bacterium]